MQFDVGALKRRMTIDW